MGRHTQRPQRRTVSGFLGDQLLNLAAAAGLLCLILVVLAWIFGVSIMMFRTGSMEPAIPSGSIAFVREVPATEMHPEDVVTVDRGEGVLPVTHRVTDIDDTDPATGEVTFRMKGDANDAPDVEPYSATDVKRVLFSIPGAAHVVQWFSNPYVLGGLTLGATVLVVWAFWPRDGDDDDAEGHEEESGKTVSTALLILAVPLAVTSSAAGLLAAAPSAVAASDESEHELHRGEHLRMMTIGDPQSMKNLAPGDSQDWQVGVWADAPEPGEITVSMSVADGPDGAADGLTFSGQACSQPWSEGVCPNNSDETTEVLAPTSAENLADRSGDEQLLTLNSDEQVWVNITGTLAESADEQTEATVTLRAVGHQEEVTAPFGADDAQEADSLEEETEPLPATGAGPWIILTMVGGALILTGAWVYQFRKRGVAMRLKIAPFSH